MLVRKACAVAEVVRLQKVEIFKVLPLYKERKKKNPCDSEEKLKI